MTLFYLKLFIVMLQIVGLTVYYGLKIYFLIKKNKPLK